ncbi:uncharacterized protein PAC_14563 [Phialocephala subalpina]|uniref:BZIP domain-containing protein n=1 Tax=Phialocephala subalpina TaxID=576137 RepID=A0A1L7XHZ7_9HELO|nr:uncharacterized protein PAC_14563 [Phialocephala subalpina]
MIRVDHENNKRAGEDPDKRRTRNRLSQQAYRRRQSEKVRELQKCAEAGNIPQSEAFEKLRSENHYLRKSLVEVQSKLTRLTQTVQALAGLVSDVLDECPAEGSKHKDAEVGPFEGSNGITQAHVSEPEPLRSALCSVSAVDDHLLPSLELLTTASGSSELSQVYARPGTSCDGLDWQGIPDNISYLFPQIPNIWSHEYQMGLQPYARALSGSECSSLMLSKPWTETNSPFSDHISVLHHLMRTSIGQIGSQSKGHEMLYRQVLAVLALFNSLTRPAAMAWYAKTRFYHIVDLTAWQLYPCPEMLNRIHKQYQPTMLQLQHQYPGIIDWAPFPSLRNRLICLHAANPQIDQIFVDIVSSYVVEACMADLVLDAPTTMVYVRVIDVAMGAAGMGNKDVDPSAVLPAPDVASLFSVAECAQAVFKLLNMDHGVSQYKLDPSFFGTYPELFDPENDIAAQGVPIRPNNQTRLPCPSRLDDLTFQTYRSFMEFHTLAPFQSAPGSI